MLITLKLFVNQALLHFHIACQQLHANHAKANKQCLMLLGSIGTQLGQVLLYSVPALQLKH